MARQPRSVTTLRVIGPTLIPEEITKLLGAAPSKAQTRGEQIVSRKTGKPRTAKTGVWRLDASDRKSADLDGQIQELFAQLTDDPRVWANLGRRFEVDLYCRLYMNVGNEGLPLSVRTLSSLGRRGIDLELDLYIPNEELRKLP